MYAILKTGGKQYRVTEGDVIYIEKLEIEDGKSVTFEEVLAYSDGKKLKTGKPYLNDVIVKGKVISTGKGKKIIVFKFKPKKTYKRTQGHRQPYTKVEITKISVVAKKETTIAKKEAVKKVTTTTAKKEAVK